MIGSMLTPHERLAPGQRSVPYAGSGRSRTLLCRCSMKPGGVLYEWLVQIEFLS